MNGIALKNPFLPKRKKVDAKYLKKVFVLFYFLPEKLCSLSFFQNDLQKKAKPGWRTSFFL